MHLIEAWWDYETPYKQFEGRVSEMCDHKYIWVHVFYIFYAVLLQDWD